ncbi:MAG: beta-ketoacyl synthase [Bacteroidales bacterium]|nr:beta-ketoacyl synthase [Bacteroidales bacterium]
MEETERNHIIHKIGEGVVTPLGFTADAVYAAIRRGERGGVLHEGTFGVPEPFFASILDKTHLRNSFSALTDFGCEGFTHVEMAAILAANQAIEEANIAPDRSDVQFILSTTKGNVDLLEYNPYEPERPYLWHTAQMVADFFGNPNRPIVASNACISGCAAQVEAFRQLRQGTCKYAVVVGVDMLSKFVVSGFQSFKALSPELCKPFDANRRGLNLGEAAAAIVYTIDKEENVPAGELIPEGWAIRNDANHISGPSRTGEGLLRAIQAATHGHDATRIAFINAHGTATPYNDDMESMAISRAGLTHTPVNSLKGYLGHTLGAAGILEVILSAHALRDHVAIPSAGTETPGTVAEINICYNTNDTLHQQDANAHSIQGDHFLKLISGFGGSNAALLFRIKQ